MDPAPPPPDARREQLRRQAIQRRQAVLDRIVGTRTIVIGGVIMVSCVLAGYLDASAHTRTASSATTVSNGYGSSSYDTSGQGAFGGGSAPSASSGAGTVVSGGS